MSTADQSKLVWAVITALALALVGTVIPGFVRQGRVDSTLERMERKLDAEPWSASEKEHEALWRVMRTEQEKIRARVRALEAK